MCRDAKNCLVRKFCPILFKLARLTSLHIIATYVNDDAPPQSMQGAIKHGRGNGDSAPDLCVMRVSPLITLRTKILKTNMAGESDVSFPCSDTTDDVLWGINDVEEDENEAADDI